MPEWSSEAWTCEACGNLSQSPVREGDFRVRDSDGRFQCCGCWQRDEKELLQASVTAALFEIQHAAFDAPQVIELITEFLNDGFWNTLFQEGQAIA